MYYAHKGVASLICTMHSVGCIHALICKLQLNAAFALMAGTRLEFLSYPY